MSDFDDFAREVGDGIEGKNSGIPMGFNRLNNHISIRRSTNFLIGGYTGSGKTALLDDAFVLNPVDYYISNCRGGCPEIEIIYWSKERRKTFKYAKWLSRKIFLDTGNIIPVNRMMGWCPKEERLTKDEHDIILTYRDYLEALLSIVTIIDQPTNPTGIRNYIRDHAKRNGDFEEVSEFKRIYVPKKPNKITLNITDHIGLMPKEKGLTTKKEVIDKASEDKRWFRDFLGYSNVDVSQFNRDIANPMRIKNGDVEPQLEDFKESGTTQEDADVVLSLFDPMRYKVPDPAGYNLDKLRDSMGRKKYRYLKILKNSYGSDDIGIGLALQPEVGLFKEMPKQIHMTDDVYGDIIGNQYFFTDYQKR
jgi:hypothetical protein